jgi:hypothetical protein
MNSILKVSILIIVSSILSSCDKSKIRMTVIKDCTGTYLRNNSRDYYVCNDDLLESYSAGDKVRVSYDELEECFGVLEPVTCEMVHLYNGKIELTELF